MFIRVLFVGLLILSAQLRAEDEMYEFRTTLGIERVRVHTRPIVPPLSSEEIKEIDAIAMKLIHNRGNVPVSDYIFIAYEEAKTVILHRRIILGVAASE